MKIHLRLLATAILFLSFVLRASAQSDDFPTVAGAPPKLLLLVHQEFRSGKANERRKIEAAISRACDQIVVPNSWVDLESISGPPEALSFDPFDSFDEVDAAYADWSRIFAAHPEMARMQEELQTLITAERAIIAIRRDDLGYRPQSIDFSKARFMRILEVRLNPGHESGFVEAFRILSRAYEAIKANTPWVVYQVNVGMPSPAFIIFLPMRALRQNDDLLDWRRSIREAEGQDAAQRSDQIAREAYLSMESNLYALSPETSHVSKDFAEGDPEFWSSKRPNPPKPAARKEKEDDAKPKP
jgi:hypothetical protein